MYSDFGLLEEKSSRASPKKSISRCLGRDVKKGNNRERKEVLLKYLDNTRDVWNKKTENLYKKITFQKLCLPTLA